MNIIRSSARIQVLAGLLLSAAAFSSTARGAVATLYTKGLYATPEPSTNGSDIVSQPGGGIYHGTHMWYSDGLSGFMRLDPATPVPIAVFGGYAAGGSYAQVAYDAGHDTIYVADQGSKGIGIVRLTFAANEQIGNACYVAPSFNGRRPSAVALGPDGNLYAGFLTSGDIVRLPIANLPAPPHCQAPPVVTIGKSIKGGRVNGLAFVGGDLYIAGKDGLTKIPNASSCLSGCTSQLVPGAANTGHFGIWSDGIDTIYYLRDANVMRYRVSTGVHEVFANSGTLADGTVTPFMFVGGKSNMLTQDMYGNLWVGDDTSDGVGNCTGRVWFIAAGQAAVQ
ncbi:MAG TPA: hypothetical protein VEU96_22475 [Bryobacteraceae bacterium]|nr:hypothetical protein [Bryobacteraceae bacterium]